MNLIASPYSGWLEMGRGQVVKASGFDPVIPGSNPGVPANFQMPTGGSQSVASGISSPRSSASS